MNKPTYETVRDEAITSLDQIVAEVSDPKDVVRRAEDDPYPCSDRLSLSPHEGAFYTGHWTVYLPDTFDINSFISDLPEQLDHDWEKRDLGTNVSFPNVYLVNRRLNLSVTVEDAEIEGRKAIDLIAISRCGILPGATSTEPGGFLSR